MKAAFGNSADASRLVLRTLAATFERLGSQRRHSFLPSLFRLSPLTDIPLTALRDQRLLRSRRMPQASLTGFGKSITSAWVA